MPNFMRSPLRSGSRDGLEDVVEGCEQLRLVVLLAQQDAEPAAAGEQVTCAPARPWAGEQLGWQQRVGVEALLELDADDERAREELRFAEPALLLAHLLQRLGDAFVDVDERLVARGQLVDGPQASR